MNILSFLHIMRIDDMKNIAMNINGLLEYFR